jgi:hypothetical protein
MQKNSFVLYETLIQMRGISLILEVLVLVDYILLLHIITAYLPAYVIVRRSLFLNWHMYYQPVIEFSDLYETRKFISMFERTHHYSLFWGRRI